MSGFRSSCPTHLLLPGYLFFPSHGLLRCSIADSHLQLPYLHPLTLKVRICICERMYNFCLPASASPLCIGSTVRRQREMNASVQPALSISCTPVHGLVLHTRGGSVSVNLIQMLLHRHRLVSRLILDSVKWIILTVAP